MNIPNTITLVRILLVPVLVFLLLDGNFTGALWVFLAAGISDALDGLVAKRFDICTRLGSLLDPLADKFLLISSVIVLTRAGHLPFWLALAIVVRDIIIIGGAGAYYLRSGRLEMVPSLPSKLNTFMQICLIFIVIVQQAGLLPVSGWIPFLVALTLVTTLVSGGHYVMVWSRKAEILQ